MEQQNPVESTDLPSSAPPTSPPNDKTAKVENSVCLTVLIEISIKKIQNHSSKDEHEVSSPGPVLASTTIEVLRLFGALFNSLSLSIAS